MKLFTVLIAVAACGDSPDLKVATPGGMSEDARPHDAFVPPDAPPDALVYEDAHEFHDALVYMDAPAVVERTCANVDTIFTHPTSTTTTEQLVLYVDCGTYSTAGHSLITFRDQSSNTDSHFVDLNCNVNNFIPFDEGNVTVPVRWQATHVVGPTFAMDCTTLP